MGLLERVQKKAGVEGDRPNAGMLNPGPAPAPLAERAASSPAAPTPPTAPQRPPLAPMAAAGRKTQGSSPLNRAANALIKPTAAQAQFQRVKSRVHARLVEEMQD